MELRTASSPRDVKTYDTARLREEFLIQNLFLPDQVKMVYSHIDRIITGAARTQYDPTKPAELYTWGAGSWLLLLPIGICLLGVIFLSFFAFGRMKKKDQ